MENLKIYESDSQSFKSSQKSSEQEQEIREAKVNINLTEQEEINTINGDYAKPSQQSSQQSSYQVS